MRDSIEYLQKMAFEATDAATQSVALKALARVAGEATARKCDARLRQMGLKLHMGDPHMRNGTLCFSAAPQASARSTAPKAG